jgi:O-antigen biosynthesis protein
MLLGGLDAPVALADLELSEGLPSFPPPSQPGMPSEVLALVRLHTQPIGMVSLTLGQTGLTSEDVGQHIDQELGPSIAAHLQHDGMSDPSEGTLYGATPPCLRHRAEILAAGPWVSVIIATRDRPRILARCLDSVLAVDYPRVEVVVVDNDPETSATADLIASEYQARGVRYVREPQRGLAAAHNCGVEAASGELLAFTDDDVVVDRDWVTALAAAFTLTDGVGAVTGLIVPGELRTASQVGLERHGRFTKGFEPKVFDLEAHRPADRRFPLGVGQCGSGANMAFNPQCLRRIGGFNPALGTGTAAKGGDDLAAFFAVITAGYRIVYQPAAVVRHWHRDGEPALVQQAYGYGVGWGAYLTDAVVTAPGVALKAALRATWQGSGPDRHSRWPRPDLRRLWRRGAMMGPVAYATSRWNTRAVRRPV